MAAVASPFSVTRFGDGRIAVFPTLARVGAGLRASWPAPGKGRGGRCFGELAEVRGGGGVPPVSGVRRITLFIPVYGLSGEGD